MHPEPWEIECGPCVAWLQAIAADKAAGCMFTFQMEKLKPRLPLILHSHTAGRSRELAPSHSTTVQCVTQVPCPVLGCYPWPKHVGVCVS